MRSPPQRRVDWDAARRRLDTVRQALEAADGSGTADEATLRARAAALARPPQTESGSGETMEAVVFSLAGERWAVPAREVVEVRRLSEVIAIPCTPPFVAGVMPLRGRVVVVLDLRRLFDIPGRALSDRSCALITGDASFAVALLAEALLGLEVIDTATLNPALPGIGGRWRDLLLGVASSGTALIDGRRLRTDPRLVVDNRPGDGD